MITKNPQAYLDFAEELQSALCMVIDSTDFKIIYDWCFEEGKEIELISGFVTVDYNDNHQDPDEGYDDDVKAYNRAVQNTAERIKRLFGENNAR